MRSLRWRRLSDLSQVDRVDLYTRQSLQVMLWFLAAIVLITAAASDDITGARTASVVAGAVVVSVLGSRVMLAAFAQYPRAHPLPWRRLVPLLLACAIYFGAVVLATTVDVRGSMVSLIVASLAWSLGALPDNRISASVVVVAGLLFGVSVGSVAGAAVGIGVGIVLVAAARAALWMFAMVTELDTARRAQAQLAVAEERLRFSRDVHDVLGRRLSTIAVQSELAATLAERNDDRAIAQMLEVRGVAHETLREARELARGYRPTDLSTELAGARSLLASAGIDVGLDIETVPRAWHEPAGWVVRESVTNVLRHSAATLVNISYADGELRVVNNGVRPGESGEDPSATDPARMSGLQGLRERLEPLGADLVVEQDGDRWSVVARLPASGPLSSAVSAEVIS